MLDPFHRKISYLRLSVTDRCDFRCTYCMSEKMKFLPKNKILSLEELERLCSVFINKGINKIYIFVKPTNWIMGDKMLLSVEATESGLEIKIDEEAYGNLALVGVLERIKFTLITESAQELKPSKPGSFQKYDA